MNKLLCFHLLYHIINPFIAFSSIEVSASFNFNSIEFYFESLEKGNRKKKIQNKQKKFNHTIKKTIYF